MAKEYNGFKCVGYYRTSTNKQDDFAWQQNVVRRFAEEQGMTIVKEYKEHISGAKLAHERPIFSEACRYCDQTGCVMICASIDRLMRNNLFPFDFPKELRGDFDILCIADGWVKGYASIEQIAWGIMKFNNLERTLKNGNE